MLESTYKDEQNLKLLKKIKIKASIRLIQRAWRRYHNSVKVKSARTIQRWYRGLKQRKEERQRIRLKVMDRYFVPRLQHRLRDAVKVWHSKRFNK